MSNEKKSMGPFQAIGRMFGMVGTVIDTADTVLTRSSGLIETGFDALEIPMDNMLADLRCDSIVDDAERDVRIATAQAEAQAIRAELKPTPRKPRKATAKPATK